MKSLEERIADREARKEKALKDADTAREVLATGTLAEGNTGDTGKDYSGFTVAELKEELDVREVTYKPSDKKADLVALIEQHDVDNAEEEEEE